MAIFIWHCRMSHDYYKFHIHNNVHFDNIQKRRYKYDFSALFQVLR